jgi:hypothetical protein
MTGLLQETARTPLDELEDRLDGELLKPGGEGWDDARTAWNLHVSSRLRRTPGYGRSRWRWTRTT